jgi:hypothetical protein
MSLTLFALFKLFKWVKPEPQHEAQTSCHPPADQDPSDPAPAAS